MIPRHIQGILLFFLLPLLPPWAAGADQDSRGMRLAVPKTGAYNGAYMDFGEHEDNVTLEGIEKFERLSGKKLAIVASSSHWGRMMFPAENFRVISAYGAVPLVYWHPWDVPFREEKGQDRFSLPNILAGRCDAYIASWAEGARAYGKPILVVFGMEMNGIWFPWSGSFHGGGNPAPEQGAGAFQGPELYKKAYRYVVDLVRKSGADNIAWVFVPNNYAVPMEPWNRIASYYPGPEYVDWLGMIAYGKQHPGPDWASFDVAFPAFYKEVCALDPEKPFIMAEWGVGEFPKQGNKAAFIEETFRRFPTDFPRLKAAVYWHERWQNKDENYSNLRINSSKASLEAFRRGVANPFWLDRPQFEKLP